MKKRHLLALIPMMCLSSCGSKLTGTYKFMLGREGHADTQLGIAMTLEDKPYEFKEFLPVARTVADMNELNNLDTSTLADGDVIKVVKDDDRNYHFYTYDAGIDGYDDNGQMRPFTTIETITGVKSFTADLSVGNAFGEVPEEIKKCLSKGLTGFYQETEYSDAKFGKRISLGTIFNENGIPGSEYLYNYIANKISVGASSIARFILEADDTPISGGNLKYLMTTYVNDKTLTMKVPVSIEDAQLQLAWYGQFIDITPNYKSKIHSLEDFLDYALEIFANGYKKFDLKEHKEFSEEGDSYVYDYEPVELPGALHGEARFGTAPTTEDVEKYNRFYANELSNTFAYKNSPTSVDEKVICGAFTRLETKVGNVKRTTYYYYDRDNVIKPSDTYFDTDVFFEYGDTYKKVRINFARDLTKNTIKYDPNLGLEIAGLVDATDPSKGINLEDFWEDPFTYRIFHDLPLSLSK